MKKTPLDVVPLFLAVFLLASAAFAGYGASPTATSAGTDSGNAGSSVLLFEATAVSNGSNYATFQVSKKDHTAFTTAGTLSILLDCGSASCQTVTSAAVSVGTFARSFTVYLPPYVTAAASKNFFARYAASTGGYWTYAGPILIYTPALAVPAAGAATEITADSARLSWGFIDGADSYRYQVTASTSFVTSGDGSVCSNCVANGSLGGTTQVVSGLATGTVYRWRVRGGNSVTGQVSNWSTVQTFTTVAVKVTAVSPTTAVLGQTATFTVTGTNLPAGMGFWIADCAGVTEVAGGGATSRQFRCTPSTGAGVKAGEVKTAPGGTSLFTFSLSVSAQPVVTSVAPGTVVVGDAVTFTVYGSNLAAGMGFWVADCAGITEAAGGSSSSRQFLCTAGAPTGSKAGEVKTVPGGALLRSFTVEVIPRPTVDAVQPLTAILGQSTTFTVTGSGLPAGMGFWVHDCAGVAEITGGNAAQRQFQCIPGSTLGAKPGEVKTMPGGTLLRSFTVNAVTRPAVTAVTPAVATTGRPTTFTVQGSDLPAGMGFWIDGCAGVTELAGGSSGSRPFQCTPQAGGARAGVVKVARGGTDLLTFSVVVSDPPAVTAVTPATAVLGQATTFTVSGGSLPAGLGFWIADCVGVSEFPGGTAASRQFRCTPGTSAGQKAGEVKTAPGGELLKSFNVSVSGAGGYRNVDAWAQAAADFLVQRGIVTDPPDHDLHGTSSIQRAELAALLYRGLGGGINNADASFAAWHGGLLRSPFTDVSDPAVWYYKPAVYLGNLTFGDGVSAFDRAQSVFRPAGRISRAWSVKALLEAWDIHPLTSFAGVTLFTDVPTTHPTAGYIYKAVEQGIVTGTNGAFSPDADATRQDLFLMMHRLMDAAANAHSLAVPSPVPLAPADFDDAGAFAVRFLGRRYEQPVLTGVHPPSVTISVLSSGYETLGPLTGVYTVTLQANLTGLDPGAVPFCAWEADGGSLVDMTQAGGVPFSRVKWIAPTDRSPADGSISTFPVTLFAGDGLGSEVQAVYTVTLGQSPATDPSLPLLAMDPLPQDRAGGDLVTVAGSVLDSGDAEGTDFGGLQIFLFWSADNGATWSTIGRAALRSDGRWDRDWRLPDVPGALLVRARAMNVRGNRRDIQAAITVAPRLAIGGQVVDTGSAPLANAQVTLSEGGIDLASVSSDTAGAFSFAAPQGPLVLGKVYTITAVAATRRATARGIVLSGSTPRAEQLLVIGVDSTPPVTEASAASGTYSAPFAVSLTCQDDDSGCGAAYYTTDGSAPTTVSRLYTGPIAVGVATTLRFLSVDHAGNLEDARTRTYGFAPCSFTVSPASAGFVRAGGSGEVSVSTLDDCAWTVVSNTPWITVTSGASSRGSSSAAYAVAPNSSGAPRTGALTVAGQSVTVSEEAAASYTLTVTRAGTGTGTVIGNPAGIACGGQCAAAYPEDTPVTLTATADPGSYFAGWTGGICFGTLPCTVSLHAVTAVGAVFTGGEGLHLAASFPAAGDTGVSARSSIRLSFSGEIQIGPAYSAIELRSAGGSLIETGRTIDPAHGIVLLTPAVLLADGTVYTVTVPAGAVLDATGSPLAAPASFSFTTEQPGNPQMFIAAYPALLLEAGDTLVSLWVDRAQSVDRTITLTSSPAGLLQHPDQVVLPAGESLIELHVRAVANYLVEADRAVTLTAQSGGVQSSVALKVLDDDAVQGNPLWFNTAGLSGDTNGNGIFEAGEVADLTVYLFNSGSSPVFNGITVSVQPIDSYSLSTLSGGTCLIGSINASQNGQCKIGLRAGTSLPSGRYTLRIKATWAGGASSLTDYASVNVVNSALPDFQVNGASTFLTVPPGTVFSRSFSPTQFANGFSLRLPRVQVLLQRENDTPEILYSTYGNARGDLFTDQKLTFSIAAPAVPGTYHLWAEVNPAGADRIAESNLSNNLSPVITLFVTEPNLAPELAPVGDKAVDAGTLLTFAASAHDPNPSDTLTYSLAGAPAGAAIDPVTGVFTWIPTDAQGPADDLVTVRVTDSGAPLLSDAETITLRVTKRADLAVTLDDGAASAAPGEALTYTLRVVNGGPSGVTGASVSALLPASLTGVTWSCTASGGGRCGATGAGAVADIADLPAGGVATYTLTGKVLAGATGSLQVSATVAAPAGVNDPAHGNDAATDVDTLAPEAALAVTLTDGRSSAAPGETLTYTITVTNQGPSPAPGVLVSDALPAALTGAFWTCTPSGGASCRASGSGSILETVDLPAGSSLGYTLVGVVGSDASGPLVNTVTVTPPAGTRDPDPGDNRATDTDAVSARADLSLALGAPESVAAGGQLVFTLTVTNAGPSPAREVEVADTLPPGAGFIAASGQGWSCAFGAGTVTCSIAELAAGTAPGITLLTTAPASLGPSADSGTVSSFTNDPEEADNHASAVVQVVPAPYLDFYTVAPCRVLDTRSSSPLLSGLTGRIQVAGICGIPSSAKSVAINVTAVAPTGQGYVTLWPADAAMPVASVINFMPGLVRSNNAILRLATDGGGDLSVAASVAGSGTVHLVVDVTGYFQ